MKPEEYYQSLQAEFKDFVDTCCESYPIFRNWSSFMTWADGIEQKIAQLTAEIARRDEELLELNDKEVFIKFENEDELPAEIKDDVYSAMFECSHVDGVRLHPYIEENGQKYFLVMLKEDV